MHRKPSDLRPLQREYKITLVQKSQKLVHVQANDAI